MHFPWHWDSTSCSAQFWSHTWSYTHWILYLQLQQKLLYRGIIFESILVETQWDRGRSGFFLPILLNERLCSWDNVVCVLTNSPSHYNACPSLRSTLQREFLLPCIQQKELANLKWTLITVTADFSFREWFLNSGHVWDSGFWTMDILVFHLGYCRV